MAIVLSSAEVHQAATWAALPDALGALPWGASWASGVSPLTPQLAGALRWLLVTTATLSLMGLFTRLSMILTCVLLFAVLGTAQRWGTIHAHHLLWFTALLAASPCGDALSIDAWRADRRHELSPRAATAYGLPVRAVWVSIGLIFFFPGYWKWRTLGLDWALSDNLLHQLHFKWAEMGELPALRLDHWPALLHAGGLGVLLFEPTLLPLLCIGAVRRFAVAAALAFHLATQVFFFINFSSLWACYLVFVPWSRWLAIPAGTAPSRRWSWPPAVAAVVVLSGQCIAGFLCHEHGWPFACYPTFRDDPGTQAGVLIIEDERRDGRRSEMPLEFLHGVSGQKQWSAMWQVIRQPTAERLRAWWHQHDENPSDVSRVRFYQGTLDVDPDVHAAPMRGRLILELPAEP